MVSRGRTYGRVCGEPENLMCLATAVTGMKALAASAMKLHLIGTLESITFPHKQKALTMEHINIPLIILNIKSGVETASVP